MSEALVDVRQFHYINNDGGTVRVVHVSAGKPTTVDMGAFKRTTWPTTVEVHVSPTGRSVQVHVNGQKWVQA